MGASKKSKRRWHPRRKTVKGGWNMLQYLMDEHPLTTLTLLDNFNLKLEESNGKVKTVAK